MVEININNEKIDFTLENEKTLGEVVSGVKDWLYNSGYYITKIEQDDNEILLSEKDNWNKIGLNKISNLNFEIKTQSEILLSKLTTINEYIKILLKSLEKNNINLFNELMIEYPYIKEGLLNLITKKDFGIDFINIETISVMLKEIEKSNNENKAKLESILTKLSIILSGRIKEISHPIIELSSTVKLLRHSIKEITDISVLLQTGKDRQAMEFILHFTELSQKMIRIYPYLKEAGILDIANITISKRSFSDFYAELNGVLLELVEAFNHNDTVLIGDLLEYEVAPKLDELIILFDSLKGQRG